MKPLTGVGKIYKNDEYLATVSYRLIFSRLEQPGQHNMSGQIECKEFPPMESGLYVLHLEDARELPISILKAVQVDNNNPRKGFTYKVRPYNGDWFDILFPDGE